MQGTPEAEKGPQEGNSLMEIRMGDCQIRTREEKEWQSPEGCWCPMFAAILQSLLAEPIAHRAKLFLKADLDSSG
jgi:hypothetical protein